MGSCYLKVWLNIIITFIVVGSAYGETLRIGMVGEPDQLNPLYTFTMRSIYINRMTLRHFNHLGEGSKNVAQIFTKMPTFENGLSKKKLINKQWKVVSNWTIKKDVFWGDGQPVTCDDIKFSVDFAQNKNMTVAWPGYKKIQSVKSLDQKKKSCEIVFKSLEWNYNKQGFTWLIPKHLENPVYLKYNEQGAKAYMANTLYSVNPTHPGLYNGPYVVSEYKIGSHIILTPNKFNKDKKKLINKIIFKFYSSSDSLQLSFKNKEIDMISMLGINVEEAQRLKKYIKDNKLASIIKSNPSPRFKVISINLTHPILKNKEIRQALSYGFDKAKMLKGLSNGVIKPVDHLLTKNDPWFTEDPKYVKKYRFNLVKSKKLIASIKKSLKKEKIHIEILYPSGNPEFRYMSMFLKEQWKKIGIDLEPVRLDRRAMYDRIRKGNYDLAFTQMMREPEYLSRMRFHSESIPNKQRNYIGSNFSFWKNQKVDNILDSMPSELSPQKRKNLIKQFLVQLTTDVPHIPISHGLEIEVIPNNLKGHRLFGTGYASSNEVEKWHF